MQVAYSKICPNCGKSWHVIIDANPCYDTCPHCKTEFKVTVKVELEEAFPKLAPYL